MRELHFAFKDFLGAHLRLAALRSSLGSSLTLGALLASAIILRVAFFRFTIPAATEAELKASSPLPASPHLFHRHCGGGLRHPRFPLLL